MKTKEVQSLRFCKYCKCFHPADFCCFEIGESLSFDDLVELELKKDLGLE